MKFKEYIIFNARAHETLHPVQNDVLGDSRLVFGFSGFGSSRA
jgi:hypothetical protein